MKQILSKTWAKIFIALGLGAVVGLIVPEIGIALKPIGSAFLQLLGMLIVPLVFSSMTCGITSIPEAKRLGRIGGTTLLLYVLTTVAAMAIGVFYIVTFPVGAGVGFSAELTTPQQAISYSDLLLSIIPKNPIKAFADQNVLQIIMFSVLFGISLNAAGKLGEPVVKVVQSLSAIMLKMTSLVLLLTPIGVFALMASATASMGVAVLLPVFSFLLLYYAACLTHFVLVLCGLVRMGGLSIKPFVLGIRDLFATAISTCSSSACLPTSLTTSTQKLGISSGLANFVLPLGCSLNMNGSALFQIMSTIFVAQCYGVDLSSQQLVTVFMTVILATIGTASIPGAGLIMLSIVFSSVGIPLEALALLAGIDRLRDMGTTSLNVIGDVACALYVANKEGAVDAKVYSTNSVQEFA